ASVVTRLSEFLDAYERTASRNKSSHIEYVANSDHFACTDLTLHSTDKEHKTLVRKLNASFVPKKRVLVRGSNRAAQGALFRAAAGLHDAGSGKIVHPPPEKMMFLPERPYLVSGTLHELLVPPGKNHTTEQDISAILRDVELEGAVKYHGGLHTARNWLEVLS